MKIKELLEEKLGLTKALFCRETGISRPTIEKILAGKQPSLKTLKKICEYFGVDPKDYI